MRSVVLGMQLLEICINYRSELSPFISITKNPFTMDLSIHLFHTSFILLDFSLSVKAATLIFISGCDSAISSAKEGKSGFI